MERIWKTIGDVRAAGSIPGWGRSLGGRHGNPLQSSCLESPMVRGAWWATVHGVTKSQTRLSDLASSAHLSIYDWTTLLYTWNSSVAQSCPTLCDPMNRSTPGLPVHHQLPEFTQTHVHRVGDAIQPSYPPRPLLLLPPVPPSIRTQHCKLPILPSKNKSAINYRAGRGWNSLHFFSRSASPFLSCRLICITSF